MHNSYPAFSAFQQVCQEQDVAVHPDIIKAGLKGHAKDPHTYTPGAYFAAVAACAEIHIGTNTRELADKTIDLNNSGHPELQDFLASRTLASIINNSVEYAGGLPWDQTYTCEQGTSLEACFFAEGSFCSTFAQMQKPGRKSTAESGTVGYQIITGENDRPIAVRKAKGICSTLSLVDISVNGITYPAGSLFKMQLRSDWNGYTYPTYAPIGQQTSVGAERVSHMTFQRLTNLAEDPRMRPSDLDFTGKPERQRVYERYDLQKLQKVAQKALKSTPPLT